MPSVVTTPWNHSSRPPATSADSDRKTATLVDESIFNKLVPSLDAFVNIIGARCYDLAKRQSDIGSHTNFAWLPKTITPPLEIA